MVLLDIGGLGLALVSPVLFAPWVIINLAVLVFGTLSWSEEMRVQREGATAAQRQAEQLRAECSGRPKSACVRRKGKSRPNVYAKRN